MCGVAGIFHYADPERPVDAALLRRMTRLLRHRGPDDEGIMIDGPVGLGHRRLSIVDPTPTGRQPMQTPDGGSWLSYNGELYNHMSYRALLTAHGVRFRGSCDTETLLHLLDFGGPQALADAAGIFALAFWQARHQRLMLVRDALGVKQMYYHDDGKSIYFASEMKALLAVPSVRRTIDYEAVNQYLHFHTPLFERTFFADIRQVCAGEYLEVGRAGVRAKAYWHLDASHRHADDPEAQAGALRELLQQVVTDQLLADVPVGSFFSGGVDSSAIAACAKRSGQRLQCFGVHFDHPNVIDERPFQEQVARNLELDLDLITVDATSLYDDLHRIMYYQDQPVIGTAMLPMYYVSRLAARRVKVCLGGQAADEVFAGYARYSLAEPARMLMSTLLPQRHPSGVDAPLLRGNLLRQLASGRNVRRLAHAAFEPGAAARYFSNFALVEEDRWKGLAVDPDWISRSRARAIFDDTLKRAPTQSPGDRLLFWDVKAYLTGLFHQDDRMSMANSLESRVPFADPRLVKLAFETDFNLKQRDGASKWLLRQAVRGLVPSVALERRKVGFDTPMEAWLQGPQHGMLQEVLLSQRSRERGLWQANKVEALLADTDNPRWFDITWKVLAIELWARVFLDKSLPTVDEEAAAHGRA